MKKNIALLALGIIIFVSCGDIIHEKKGTGLEPFQESPVTITWSGDKSEGIQTFQTNVEVYSMNNRKDTHAGLSEAYRLTMSYISEKIVTRLDFDFDESIPFRSVISDGEEFISFNPATEEIGHRIAMEDSKSPLFRILGNLNTLSKINLSLIREEARRLSLDMKEETEGNSKKLLLELPPALIPQNGSDKITRSRAVFDIDNETLMETEVVMIREDDTIVTATSTMVYEDVEGIPVKIGTVTVIDSHAPGLIEGMDPDRQFFNSPDEIPELSMSEWADMQAAGNVYEDMDMTFGDPADLSYIETIYEVYQDIEINSAPEHLFRLILK